VSHPSKSQKKFPSWILLIKILQNLLKAQPFSSKPIAAIFLLHALCTPSGIQQMSLSQGLYFIFFKLAQTFVLPSSTKHNNKLFSFLKTISQRLACWPY
jgi:hypothetical protein